MILTNAKKKKKISSFSIITVLLCSLVVVFLITAIVKEASELADKKQVKSQLETQLSDQNAENEVMSDQLSNGDIDELKEQKARENGYARPDEQIIKDITPGT